MSEVKRQFETITSNGVLWINIQKPTFADINALGQKYPFHRLNLEDCLSKIQIPKIDRYESPSCHSSFSYARQGKGLSL